MVEIIKIKSDIPETEYAPSFDISLGYSEWTEYDKIDTIREFLIRKENDIKNIEVRHDGGTGLGDKSVTARFGQYHIFDLADECPEINDMADFMRMSYIEFVTQEHNRIRELDSVCWYNILREGENIDIHSHGSTSKDYLSGNMQLDNYETNTYYQCPFDKDYNLGVQNKKGGLILFPSYIQHFTDAFQDKGHRVSVAFDLYCADFRIKEDSGYEQRLFLDQNIFQRLTH